MWMRKFSGLLTLLALIVIGLGAYTRLSDAGLGCPDWPGCYGQITVPKQADAVAAAEVKFNQAVEPAKAWIEMIHRYVAGTLALGVLVVFFRGLWQFFKYRQLNWGPIALAGVIIFQALLGMWTVTLKLYPPIILLHLFGGVTTLSLLWWYGLQLRSSNLTPVRSSLKPWLLLGLGLLLVQIALGGWTSANYAALICPDFPYCQGQLLPPLSMNAFIPGDGIVNDNATLVSIHMVHRMGAVLVGSYLLLLSLILCLKKQVKWGLILAVLMLTQISLGILNIVLLLPMVTAVTHNLVAILLVITLLSILYRCRIGSKQSNSAVISTIIP